MDKPKLTPKPAPAEAVPARAADAMMTRREFLNYAWLASIALFACETVGLSLWFAFPNFRAGQFGGEFAIGAAVEVLPEVNTSPKAYTDGKFLAGEPRYAKSPGRAEKWHFGPVQSMHPPGLPV